MLKAGRTEDTLFCEQEFSFQSHTGKVRLSGTLVMPKQFSPKGPVVILAAPPSPVARDYGGLFKSLAETLGKHGVTSLRYDNRAHVDTTIRPQSWLSKDN